MVESNMPIETALHLDSIPVGQEAELKLVIHPQLFQLIRMLWSNTQEQLPYCLLNVVIAASV